MLRGDLDGLRFAGVAYERVQETDRTNTRRSSGRSGEGSVRKQRASETNAAGALLQVPVSNVALESRAGTISKIASTLKTGSAASKLSSAASLSKMSASELKGSHQASKLSSQPVSMSKISSQLAADLKLASPSASKLSSQPVSMSKLSSKQVSVAKAQASPQAASTYPHAGGDPPPKRPETAP